MFGVCRFICLRDAFETHSSSYSERMHVHVWTGDLPARSHSELLWDPYDAVLLR